jgi:hypothetical protein
MTGYRSHYFRHTCDKSTCYIDQLPWWDDLIGCFPRNIRPTDIDGGVEINGHILILEEKARGKSLETGQRRFLKALTERPKTVVVVFRPGIRSDMQVLMFGHNQPADGYWDVSRDWLLNWLRQWVAQAEGWTA